jgi:transcriptional antiterminator RfaH
MPLYLLPVLRHCISIRSRWERLVACPKCGSHARDAQISSLFITRQNLSTSGFNMTLSWYAIHTKPKQEKRAVANLRSFGLETLAPLTASGAEGHRAFFPGYIFARFDSYEMLHKVNLTRGVAHVVSFGGTPPPVPDEVIVAIRSRMQNDGVVYSEQYLEMGDAVRIQAGPLRSFKGVFEQHLQGHERVRILLTTVAYSIHCQLPGCQLLRLSSDEH